MDTSAVEVIISLHDKLLIIALEDVEVLLVVAFDALISKCRMRAYLLRNWFLLLI